MAKVRLTGMGARIPAENTARPLRYVAVVPRYQPLTLDLEIVEDGRRQHCGCYASVGLALEAARQWARPMVSLICVGGRERSDSPKADFYEIQF